MKNFLSFWTTLPGVLTAAGTLVASITALITALVAAGVIGGSHGSALERATPTPVPPTIVVPMTTQPTTPSDGGPGGEPIIALDPASGNCKTTVQVSGSRFHARETVELTIQAIPWGTTETDNNGSFVTAIQVPEVLCGFGSGFGKLPEVVSAHGEFPSENPRATFTLEP